MTFSFRAEVWRWEAQKTTAWFFVSLPEAVSDDIDAEFGHRAAGFGSLRVAVRIGGSTWETSVFPDKQRATYVLPLKKQVRVAEHLDEGATADVELTVIA